MSVYLSPNGVDVTLDSTYAYPVVSAQRYPSTVDSYVCPSHSRTRPSLSTDVTETTTSLNSYPPSDVRASRE